MSNEDLELDEQIFDELLEDENFEAVIERILSHIGALVSISGYGHVIDGELTSLPSTEFDTIH